MIALQTKGTASGIAESIVGRITRDASNTDPHSIFADDSNWVAHRAVMPSAILTTSTLLADHNQGKRLVHSVASLDHLAEGDIVAVSPEGRVRTLYRVNSFHNTLMATERCNSNCLMCSQPPKDRNDVEYLYQLNRQTISLIPKDCFELGISGGEPTLMGDLFFDMMTQIKEELPDTEIHLLTNGRTFAWHANAERLGEINNTRLMLGIPLYSDYYQQHDHIVQAQNAFSQTVLGLHNLARYNQRLEVRVVLHKLSVPRLVKLAKYIYKNLPFVEHVAFMGLEEIGYTPFNMDKLWVDPYEYAEDLGEAVSFLSTFGIHVSIYNIQLCLLPESLWQFARKSISDWKNDYLPACNSCAKKGECAGFFVWNLKNVSPNIKPFAEVPTQALALC